MRHYTNPMDSLSQCRVSLQDAYQEIVDCKAKLADAEAERSEARSLLLNGIQTNNGDSLAFLEHVRREHAAVVAERDALLRIINDSFLSMNNPTSTLAFDGRNLVPHVEDASRYAEILLLERDALKAKLAALVESCEMALDIDSEDISVGAFHDKWRGAPGYGNGDGSREILSKALAAAKEQP